MPSPVGHAIGGIAAGWLIEALGGVQTARVLRMAAAFALVGMLPDADLLIGAHRGPMHGLGSALIAGLAAAALTRRAALAVAVAAAYASHTLLDWMGHDTTPPIGLMALWPIDRSYYQSQIYLFDAISRRYWLPEFWSHNMWALARELLILVPIVAAIGMWRWRRASRQP